MSTQLSFKHTILFLAIVLIVCYSIYYDLTAGTLPKIDNGSSHSTYEQDTPKSTEEDPFPAQEVVVDNGYTVLSIVEHLHDGPVPASIQQIIYDFQELNPGVAADQIQVGKTYLFPLYSSAE